MAKLLGGTVIYGNATVNSYLTVSGNADLSGGNVSIGNGNTTITSFQVVSGGQNYTSTPTITVSSPTTLYGATATANVTMGLYNVPNIVSGGTGYSVGDVLTISGGSPVGTSTAKITVTGNSSGVITSVTVNSGGFGNYYTLPTNPVSVTGGTGSSATFTANWTVQTVTPTYGGVGYTEPPTITFSGGGGSGATVYAFVGGPNAGARIYGLGQLSGSTGTSLLFYTPGGPAAGISDRGQITTNYVSLTGGATGSGPIVNPYGLVDSNIDMIVRSNGTGSVVLSTQGSANQQLRVTHTASAVNYVQITGGATTLQPTISAQGSDTNISLSLIGKGTGNVYIPSGALTLGSSTNMYMNSGLMIFNSTSTSSPQLVLNASGSYWGTLGTINSTSWGFGYSNSSPSQVLGNIIIGWSTNGAVIVPQTVSSTSTTTGALQVAGGAGIAGNLYVGGNIYSNNTVSTSITAVLTHATDPNFQLSAQNGVNNNATGTEIARFGINYATAGWDSFTQYIRGVSSQNGYQTLWAGNTAVMTVQSGSVVPVGNVTTTLGSSTAWWSTVYGTAIHAQYADLAEVYTSDNEYAPGTVVVFGGEAEITTTNTSHDTRVAGVISTNPAYLMNDNNQGLPVALTGRVPCRVQGPVVKGQVLVTSNTPGVAQAIDNGKFLPGCVIGKSLQAINTNAIETIEVVVGRF